MRIRTFFETIAENMVRKSDPRRDFRTAAAGAVVEGRGKIIRLSGEELDFVMTGRTSQRLIGDIVRQVFGSMIPAKQLGAITHNATLRNTLCDAVVDALDAGAGAGIIRMETGAAALLATLTFSDPAFGAASGGTATANAITDETSATAGTMAQFETRDSNAVSVFLGSVATSGADINFNQVILSGGETVSISSLTYSASA